MSYTPEKDDFVTITATKGKGQLEDCVYEIIGMNDSHAYIKPVPMDGISIKDNKPKMVLRRDYKFHDASDFVKKPGGAV